MDNELSYKILKNVVLPPASTFKNKAPKKAFRLTLERMEVGDSVVVNKKEYKYAGAVAKMIGITVTVRKLDNVYTVWRTA